MVPLCSSSSAEIPQLGVQDPRLIRHAMASISPDNHSCNPLSLRLKLLYRGNRRNGSRIKMRWPLWRRPAYTAARTLALGGRVEGTAGGPPARRQINVILQVSGQLRVVRPNVPAGRESSCAPGGAGSSRGTDASLALHSPHRMV